MEKQTIENCTLYLGDCVEVMAALAAGSVDSIVTDPPYGIGFMGKAWDGKDIKKTVARKKRKNTERTEGWKTHEGEAFAAGTYDTSLTGNQSFQVWTQAWAAQALRVLKPGGHLISFSSPRTYHRMVAGIEDAGFEIRDQLGWLFGSGFPKSHNLKDEWDGWGTALKPAHEPICLARKPFKGTVANNVQKHCTGAINVDGCRIGTEDNRSRPERSSNLIYGNGKGTSLTASVNNPNGRWPANLIHDGGDEVTATFPDDNSRFYYCPKASKADRDEGLEGFAEVRRDDGRKVDAAVPNLRTTARANHHPTVKPTDLMRYLCRLITPPGGVVLDPFMGSGSTGKAAVLEGFGFIGVDITPDYMEIIKARIAHAHVLRDEEASEAAAAKAEAARQIDLFTPQPEEWKPMQQQALL